MKKWLLILFCFILIGCNNTTQELIEAPVSEENLEIENLNTVTFEASDGLTITADLYMIDDTSPIFILFHQAGWSRGEYLETAVKFNKMGYNAVAVDLRSGIAVNDITNETARLAKESDYPNNHADAALDVKASIEYIIEEYDTDIYLLGSSYSASLALVTAEDYKDHIDAVFAFSPGEYFIYDGKSIAGNVESLTIPTFITSASYEVDEWKNIFEHVAAENKFAFYPENFGSHGSESLWKSSKENIDFWNAIFFFIDQLKEDA